MYRSAKTSKFLAVVCMLSISVPVSAALIDRGNGMIYDNDLNITWLQDANYAQTSGYDADGRMTWGDATTWASNLVYGGYSDWRLPMTLQPDPSCSGQTNGVSYNWGCAGSEMGHLFYNELGGTVQSSISTSSDPDLALFHNLQTSHVYWSGNEYTPGSDSAWGFFFSGGFQYIYLKDNENFAWAVRSGDVATVPIPGAIWLFASGLLGLGFVRRKTA